MSAEGVERIREGLAALNRRDFDAAVALADPDFVFENDPGGPLGPTVYRGRAEVKGFWEDWFGTWKDLRAEAKYFRAVGDEHVLVRLHTVAHVEASEAPLEFDFTQLWTRSGGIPTRARIYFDHAEALEAVGLREQEMSDDNVEVVRRAVEAFNARDVERGLRLTDPEIEYRSVVEDKVYRGHAGLVRFWLDVDAAMEEWHLDDNRFFDAGGDRVVHLYRVVGRGKESGVRVTGDFAILWQLRGGKLLKGEVYLDQRRALEAAGLRE